MASAHTLEEDVRLESEENSPVKQVALTVPTTDDPTMPVVTFRMWVLGIISCVLLSFLNEFFWYRTPPLTVTAICAQIAVVPLGHLMAKVIPNLVLFKGSRFEFSLNPGPFNVKEHVLITIFANAGAYMAYASNLVNAVKLLSKRKLTFLVAMILVRTSQFLGLSIAGIFRRFLVEPAEMWWPGNLVQVSLFRALHDKEKRTKGRVTRNQFFLLALVCSFSYYVVPGFFFPMLTSISWVCWIFSKSILGQKFGSGSKGIGIGAFALDWSNLSWFLGSPLASPWFATVNAAAGYVMFMYIIVPISYWLDIYHAKTFPIYSFKMFTSAGTKYHINKIVNSNYELDLDAYNSYGPFYLSIGFAMTYGLCFASLTATLVHIVCFHGSEIMKIVRSSASSKKKMDIHTKLMRVYKEIPEWWFILTFLVNFVLVILACVFYKDQLQLPWWGVIGAFAIGLFYTLPIGILTATTGQAPGLNVITEYIIGYVYPGRPVANMCFKVYGHVSMDQAITFLSYLKLGHYMKIPPRSMFMAQMSGTLISSTVYLATAWWLMATVPHLCDTSQLPEGSPWTCPVYISVFYESSVEWGLIGTRRFFGDLGIYSKMNWWFLVGAIAPFMVWLAHKAFPKQKWIRLVNIPVILTVPGVIMPMTAVDLNMWIFVAFVSGFLVFRYQQNWWKRYNYVLSAGLEAGVGLMGVALFFALGSKSIDWWGVNVDECPLASCPTAKGVVVEGCPVP